MLYISGCVNDVMFSHNAVNRPESQTTLMFIMFRPVRQVAAPGRSLQSLTASRSGQCDNAHGAWPTETRRGAGPHVLYSS